MVDTPMHREMHSGLWDMPAYFPRIKTWFNSPVQENSAANGPAPLVRR